MVTTLWRDCGALACPRQGANTSAIREHSNRGLAVTDKAKSTWQKRTFRCKGGLLESVCREMPPRGAGCISGACVSSAYESWRAGVPALKKAHSDSNQ